ncbi:MAG TPA: hypothetical protein VHS31_15640 [Tepidisphaeraceae bacterium]|nr:hypothetical protein [Tepidisphaeraceae bacterium]
MPDPNLNTPLPLRPPAPIAPKPTLAPAWLALLTAWLGIVMLIASIVFIFLPGTRDPRSELMHVVPYSLADKFLPVPIYGVTVTIFLGIVILWQMRRELRPLPDAMVMQRVQAWAGIVLSLIAAAVVYIHVALHGPR